MDSASPLSWVYLPTAFLLGALHALEPGHAKTLTAAYLIGIKGTRRDAVLLGVSVAITHSIVVIAIALTALWIGRESFTGEVTHALQRVSGILVVLLGVWLIFRRLQQRRRRHEHLRSHEHTHHHEHDHDHHHNDDHDHDHDHGHSHEIPAYAERGERPTVGQILAFGAAGGLIPCPASITVMLLALSVGQFAMGALSLIGFSLGLATALVGVGLLVVTGLNRLQGSTRFQWVSQNSALISACFVLLSGVLALVTLH